MATERLEMHQAKEILRQKLELGRSHRQVAASLRISAGTVGAVVSRASRAGLVTWAEVATLGEQELEGRLYEEAKGTSPAQVERPVPDWAEVHLELRRPGVTLTLLHMEYLERHPEGYRYTAWCARYGAWLARRSPRMRQAHVGGDKMFVDYSGKKARLFDPATGEVTEVELFVAVLGASSYTFVEASRSQRVQDFTSSVARALAFFGGAPRAVVPDQLKSAVTRSCRYEPGVQRALGELAQHYGTTILPARPRSPRDKAKVETAVLVAQRWVLARLRHERFGTIAELNARIGELVVDLNARPMRIYRASRRELFERLDRPALSPLPESAFEAAEWKAVRLNVDYHAEFDGHFYSASHTLFGEKLWLRATATAVEVWHAGRRVAVHARSFVPGRHTTMAEHMPASHRAHAEWTPSRILGWARNVGPSVAALCEAILAERKHPEHGYRSCLGIFRLSKRYGQARVEAACARALAARARSYRHVESILKHGLDRAPVLDADPRETSALHHENVRGGTYYH